VPGATAASPEDDSKLLALTIHMKRICDGQVVFCGELVLDKSSKKMELCDSVPNGFASEGECR
jgi:hypothetical protein